MEIKDNNSPEVTNFIKELTELSTLVKTTLRGRTPNLNGEKYLTNADMTQLLHISPRTLQEYRNNGTLPYIQISGKILYKESDVLRVLGRNYVSNYSQE